jgi:NADPH-dependent 2,4-dienoyl-CoA reductase/sulfur reductase-like enzyme
MKYVIIGAGIAGVSAALSIREVDSVAEIVIIGDERFLPYKRYQLTEFLCDSIAKVDLTFAAGEDLKTKGIKLRRGQYVKFINPSEKTIKLFHNEVMDYDKLLIATGGRPILGPVLRPFYQHIQRYYSLKDALLLKKRLPYVHRCIVYGEGLSSLDLLCGLHNLGKDVTYIIRGEKVDLPLVESEFEGELHEFLEEKGIEIINEDQVITIEKFDRHYRVITLRQAEVYGDIVFAWDYYKPNIGCIKGTGIEKKFGILVNERLETSVQDIYAAGDCVEIYHPGVKDYWINFGWPNAEEQGAVAGRNMAGEEEEYKVHETITFNLMGKSLKARWWE